MKKNAQRSYPTYKEFLTLHSLCSEEVQKENLAVLEQQPRPDVLCGLDVPTNLNALSYGQLDDLRDVNDKEDVAYQVADIIFGQTLDLLNEDVNKVFGFVNFCTREVVRINEIFGSLKSVYTKEEKAAGAESLNFGSFGILDWYAKRMGIADQNAVRDVAWVRIFQCMKNDHETNQYERRLRDQYLKSSKNPPSARRKR